MRAHEGHRLIEQERLSISGARAAESFELFGERYLAIPQLAIDVEGQAPDMNGGDSSATRVRILKQNGATSRFEECQRLSAPGGEDAEFFRIDGRAFLAVASIRSGVGPYQFAQPQPIFEWVEGRFELLLTVDGYAAKQWKHVAVDGRHFLALAQGVGLPGHEAANQPSRLYSWTDEGLEPFQDVDSVWGYNWHSFELAGEHFLAYADHVRPSILMRWSGEHFEHFQELADQHGRAFADFTVDGESYLVVARLQSPSLVLRWSEGRFREHQTLPDLGARELAVIPTSDGLFVVRVNFITGTPDAPVTALNSHVYRWLDGALRLEEQFPTQGGTDVASWVDPAHGRLVAVSNSLSPEVRFATDTVIYRFIEGERR